MWRKWPPKTNQDFETKNGKTNKRGQGVGGGGVGGLGETFTKCKIYGGQEKMKHSDLSSPVWFS